MSKIWFTSGTLGVFSNEVLGFVGVDPVEEHEISALLLVGLHTYIRWPVQPVDVLSLCLCQNSQVTCWKYKE